MINLTNSNGHVNTFHIIMSCSVLNRSHLYQVWSDSTSYFIIFNIWIWLTFFTKFPSRSLLAVDHQNFSKYHNVSHRVLTIILPNVTSIFKVTRQLFEPLVMQLIHWFTGNKKFESADTSELLNAIQVCFIRNQLLSPKTIEFKCNRKMRVFHSFFWSSVTIQVSLPFSIDLFSRMSDVNRVSQYSVWESNGKKRCCMSLNKRYPG